VLGGYGYGASVVERLWRDAKLLEIGGGTLEAHREHHQGLRAETPSDWPLKRLAGGSGGAAARALSGQRQRLSYAHSYIALSCRSTTSTRRRAAHESARCGFPSKRRCLGGGGIYVEWYERTGTRVI
jgi:hypothetical protein